MSNAHNVDAYDAYRKGYEAGYYYGRLDEMRRKEYNDKTPAERFGKHTPAERFGKDTQIDAKQTEANE